MPSRRSQSPRSAPTAAAPAAPPVPADFEKLGVFYLGRPYDLAAKSATPGLLLYDAKDLVTHGVCVGMTGSGKTGLCLSLLEEAALDGVPAIAIDPKGDLANLLLTFPDLRPEDFAPWINEDERGGSRPTVSEAQANLAKGSRRGNRTTHRAFANRGHQVSRPAERRVAIALLVVRGAAPVIDDLNCSRTHLPA
jgi:DNA helicase HerA-like ATPase